jgi:hypothetical protein
MVSVRHQNPALLRLHICAWGSLSIHVFLRDIRVKDERMAFGSGVDVWVPGYKDPGRGIPY